MAVCTWSCQSSPKDKRRQEIALEIDRGCYHPSANSIAEAIVRYLRRFADDDADKHDDDGI